MYKFIIITAMVLLTIYGVYVLISAETDAFLIFSEITISIGGLVAFLLACEEGKEEQEVLLCRSYALMYTRKMIR